MTNNTAIISGSGALATAFAQKLTDCGWQAALLSKSKPKNFAGLFYLCDFTSAQQVKDTVLAASRQLGGLTAAIHTAVSPIARKRTLDISVSEFTDSFLVDVFGGFAFFQSAGRIMKEQGHGRIVALTSEAIESPEAPSAMAGYVSAKFALKGLLKVLHRELAGAHIAVSALAPGFMDTPLNRDLPPRLIEFIKEQRGGELTTPIRVAEALYDILTMPEQECAGKTFFVFADRHSPPSQSKNF